MGKWQKPEAITVRGTCITCHTRPQMSKGRGVYRAQCRVCHLRRYGMQQIMSASERFRKEKKAYCERCGFVAEDACQLDNDHIDGNHKNNAPSNKQTLCANCHRLKTKRSNEGYYASNYHKRTYDRLRIRRTSGSRNRAGA